MEDHLLWGQTEQLSSNSTKNVNIHLNLNTGIIKVPMVEIFLPKSSNSLPIAKDLVRRMMEPNVEKRLSARESLNHRWFNLIMPAGFHSGSTLQTMPK